MSGSTACTVQYQERLYPTPCGPPYGITQDLSIADSIAGSLPPAALLWFFEKPEDSRELDPRLLVESLRETLESYPFLAGRLEQIAFRRHSQQRHTDRQGRLRVTYGSEEDEGINVTVASCASSLKSVLTDGGIYSGQLDKTAFTDFVGEEVTLAIENAVVQPNSPILSVKMTGFSCGGLALSVRQVHCVGDIQSAIGFVKDWTRVHTAVLARKTPPALSPIFDPAAVTAKAFGDINAPKPDAKLVTYSRQLPVHRFDWFAPVPDNSVPEMFKNNIVVPAGVDKTDLDQHGAGLPMPWHDWDPTAPTVQKVLHFSPKEINKIHAAACAVLPANSHVSHLDALLAHLWVLILRARGQLEFPDSNPTYLNFVMDYRPRLSLPKTLYSSPSSMVHASVTPDSVTDLGAPAAAIRSVVNQMDGAAISTILHDQAHTIGGQRHWQYFPGKHFVNVSSWARAGIWDIKFGATKPASVVPWLPDYLLIVLEGKPGDKKPVPSGDKLRWFDDGGIDIIAQLEQDVVQRILVDEEFRAYTDAVGLDIATALPVAAAERQAVREPEKYVRHSESDDSIDHIKLRLVRTAEEKKLTKKQSAWRRFFADLAGCMRAS